MQKGYLVYALFLLCLLTSCQEEPESIYRDMQKMDIRVINNATTDYLVTITNSKNGESKEFIDSNQTKTLGTYIYYPYDSFSANQYLDVRLRPVIIVSRDPDGTIYYKETSGNTYQKIVEIKNAAYYQITLSSSNCSSQYIY
jgi:hypothetical protein